MQQSKPKAEKVVFSGYQKFVIAILAILQFTVILDFMVLSPLGAILLDALHINTKQFGLVVSAYAFSAGASGLLAAGFADKFDRKKLLIFFYCGFVIGTGLCAIAPTYNLLLAARIVTGLFGGVIGSVIMAIITDLFAMSERGRVMGFVQMAFAASQVLGIPIGLLLANKFGWHSPFIMIVGFSIIVGIAIVMYLRPVDAHLKYKKDGNAFAHLIKTVSNTTYLKGFAATVLLSTGGFMLMPFGSAFSTNNLGININDLPLVYIVTGIFSIAFGPLFGKLSDKIGKYKVFLLGSLLTIAIILIYTRFGVTPLWLVIVINVFIFMGITARMVSASALMSAVPDPPDRGAYMGVNSSIMQISGGIAAAVAGMIVVQSPSGKLEHYPELGMVVAGSMVITLGMMYMINQMVAKKIRAANPTPMMEEPVI